MQTSSLLEVILCGSGSAPPVPPRTKEQVLVLLLGWCPSRDSFSSSPCVTDGLLVSSLCSWDWAGRHSKPSCNRMYGCTILEELDHLCSLIGLQLPPHAPSRDKDTRKESVRKDEEREQLSVASTCKTISFLGIVLLLPVHCPCCDFHLHQSLVND